MWLNIDDGTIYDTLDEAQNDFYNSTGLEDIINWILQQGQDYVYNILYDIFTCLNRNKPVDELIEILYQIENTMFYDYHKEVEKE